MALKVKDAGMSKDKFVQNGVAGQAAYVAGVRGSGEDWQRETAAAEANYAQGVQDAVNRRAFSAGVRDAGATKFEDRAINVGAGRYPVGIRAGADEWQRKTTPYLDLLRNLTLPPRGPVGAPGNTQRVDAVVTALRRRKTGSAT